MNTERTVDYDENTPIASRAFADIRGYLANGKAGDPAVVLRVLEAVKELEHMNRVFMSTLAQHSGRDVAQDETK